MKPALGFVLLSLRICCVARPGLKTDLQLVHQGGGLRRETLFCA